MKTIPAYDLCVRGAALLMLFAICGCDNEDKALTSAGGIVSNEEGWTSSIPGECRVKSLKGPEGEEYLNFWDGAVKEPAVTAPQFTKDITGLDLEKIERVSFEMKGNGQHNALKVALEDKDGRSRTYGPFWTDNVGWAKYEFILKIATWAGEDDRNFKIKELKRIVMLVHDVKGEPVSPKPIGIRNIVGHERMESNYAKQWLNRNIDDNGNVIAKGSKFFPIGAYSVIGSDRESAKTFIANGKREYSDQYMLELMDKIHKAGFNTIQSYTVPWFCDGGAKSEEARISGQLRLLDLAEKSGLKVMVLVYYLAALPINGSPGQVQMEVERRKAELRRMIAKIKGHPALLAYYIADEPFPSGVSREQLEGFYQTIKDCDEDHPVVLVECSEPGYLLYGIATDIIAPDCYPVAATGVPKMTNVADRLDFVKSAQFDGRPYLWNVLQIAKAFDEKKPFDNLEKGRYPTETELRLMSNLSIIKGAKGLFYFSLGAGAGEQPLIPEFAPEHWKNISNVLKGIESALPFVYSNKECNEFRVSSPRIAASGKIVDTDGESYLYLLGAFPSDGKGGLAPINVSFSKLPSAPGQTRVEVLDEDGAGNFSLGKTRWIDIRQGTDGQPEFSDTYKMNDSHVYRLKLEGSSK